MCEMKSIALNFVRWFLKNNSCDLLNEVVIRCDIVATNYLYSFIWRNFMIKYCIIICWMNVVNECSEWRIILYIWTKLSWKGCAKVCWWSMRWSMRWSCDEVVVRVCWWSCCESLLMKFYIKIVVMNNLMKYCFIVCCEIFCDWVCWRDAMRFCKRMLK